MFQNKVLQKVLVTKKEKVPGCLRKLHVAHDLYSLPNIIRVINLLKPSGFFTYHKV